MLFVQRRYMRNTDISLMLTYNEAILRAEGMTNELLEENEGWKSYAEITKFVTGDTMLFLRNEEHIVSLAYSNGKRVWWTNNFIEPTEFMVVGTEVGMVTMTFSEEDEEETDEQGKDD